jgi:hypothetical protein
MKRGMGKSNIDIVKDYLNNQRPFVTIGYAGEKNKYRTEGETWEDFKGIKWQKVNGKNVKLTKTQSDIIREAIGTRKCKCGLDIKFGNRFDQKLFAKTGMCQDCLVEYETNLTIAGLFPAYERYKLLSNELGLLNDFKEKLKETIRYFGKEDSSIEILCNSSGFQEKFHGTNKKQILKNAKEDLKKLNLRLSEVKKMKSFEKKKLMLGAKEFKIKLYV